MKTTIRTCLVFVITVLFTTGACAQTEKSSPLLQFLFPEFSTGTVKLKNNGSQSVPLNYNMIDEEMIFSQRGSYMALINLVNIDTVIIQDRKFVPVGKAFYEVIVEKDIPIFIQHKSKYTSEGTATAYGMTSQVNERTNITSMKSTGQVRTLQMPDNVKVVPEIVFWVKINGEMKKFTTERQFAKMFPEKEEDLKKFIKSSTIDIHNREDLIKLGNYCNEIIK
jgi:hypothetical protein